MIDKGDFKVYGYSYSLNNSQHTWNCTRYIDVISPSICLGEDEVEAVIFLSFPKSDLFPKSIQIVEYVIEDVEFGIPNFTEYEVNPNSELPQIIELMKKQGWEYVRIHFLCDMIAENRKSFQRQLDMIRMSPFKAHMSLFDRVNEDELDVIASSFSSLPIINAWGDTNPLGDKAKFQESYFPNSIGVKTENGYLEFPGSNNCESELVLEELSQMIETSYMGKELEEDTLVRIW